MTHNNMMKLLTRLDRWHLIDIGWLVTLMIYVLAGTPIVPFHGDESTTIWMSKDYAYIFTTGELDRVQYSDPPVDAPEQYLRLITGSVMKYLMGFSWTINGLTLSDINEQWHWGFDWQWNQDNGHMPTDALLMYGRWPSAVLLAFSVPLLFMIARAAGGRIAAYVATAFYALHPVVLLNGRRAMFEGGLLFFSLLLVLAALAFARRQTWPRAIGLGLVTGLAVATKHPAAFTAAGSYVGLLIAVVFFQRQSQQISAGTRTPLHALLKLSTAALLGFAVLVLLNPIWWSDPVTRASQVIEARSGLLDEQAALFGGYDSFSEQIDGFLRHTLSPRPQYFEVQVWVDYIGGQIREYERSFFVGPNVSEVPGFSILLIVFAVVGVVHLLRVRSSAAYVLICWAAVMVMTTTLLTPLDWQRYYLMMYPVLALFLGLGAGAIEAYALKRRPGEQPDNDTSSSTAAI